MSGDHEAGDTFLSRWSKRKREAAQSEPADEVGAPAEDQDGATKPLADGETDEKALDLASLPKLEEITEATDIRQFLREGVPESMRNAALRKSWALDPAIRNYVNPALDYAYDWNTPGGVPGNSELAVGTDIAKMVMQIMGSGSTDEAVAPDAPSIPSLHPMDASDPASGLSEIAALQDSGPQLADGPVRLSDPAGFQLPDNSAFPVTVPNDDGRHDGLPLESSAMQQPVRRHGSAKPRV